MTMGRWLSYRKHRTGMIRLVSFDNHLLRKFVTSLKLKRQLWVTHIRTSFNREANKQTNKNGMKRKPMRHLPNKQNEM
jgi:hypothetical protein